MKGKLTPVLIAVGAAGAYLVYKNWDAIKAKFQPKGEPTDPGTGAGTGAGTGTGKDDPESGNQASAYAKKVEVLQGLLQVRIDGNPGKQTNGTLDFYYDWSRKYSLGNHVPFAFSNSYPNLVKNGQGPVSPSNVDFYIQQYKDAQTPRQLSWTADKRKARGEELRNLYVNQKKKIVLIQPQETVYTFNSQGKLQSIRRTIQNVLNVFEVYRFEGYTASGSWRMRNPYQTDEYVHLDPYKFKAI